MCGFAVAAEPTCSLTVVTDRKDALYDVNDEATFLITVTADGNSVESGQVSYLVDDFLNRGKAAGHWYPGFVRGRSVPLRGRSERLLPEP